jgi:phospholipid:diacylglycerol acyltransferase
MSLLRRRRQQQQPPPPPSPGDDSNGSDHDDKDNKGKKPSASSPSTSTPACPPPSTKRAKAKWSCVDSCCWLVGCVCSAWWLLLFLYNAMPASFPQYVTEAITGPLPDPPGVKLHKEGLRARHPVVFVPGIVTGGLELWEGHQCAEGLFRKRLWGGTFGDVYKRSSSFRFPYLFVALYNYITLALCVPYVSALFGRLVLL